MINIVFVSKASMLSHILGDEVLVVPLYASMLSHILGDEMLVVPLYYIQMFVNSRQ